MAEVTCGYCGCKGVDVKTRASGWTWYTFLMPHHTKGNMPPTKHCCPGCRPQFDAELAEHHRTRDAMRDARMAAKSRPPVRHAAAP